MYLAISSSTSVVSVAFGDDKVCLAHETIATDRQHAEEITPLIEKVVPDSLMENVSYIVLDIGPGRFTGLRVGIATAKAIAVACDFINKSKFVGDTHKVAVIPLTSLQILAYSSLQSSTQAITSVVDARRKEVFQQSFDLSGALTEPMVGLPEDLAQKCSGHLVLGDGADLYQDIYNANNAKVVDSILLSAKDMIDIVQGEPEYHKKNSILPGQVYPLYLREPDAVPNVKTRS